MATITTIQETDLIKDSRSVINTNFSNINTDLVLKADLLSPAFTGTPTISSVAIPTISSTSTFTNKRITKRVVSATSYTTDTGTSLNIDNYDIFIVTAQAGALKFNNPSGTPTEGQGLIIRIKDDGTARALTYDTQYRALGNALPSTTVLSKTLYLGLIYNFTDTKWDLIAVAQET
jgi:hypothetical protein